MQRIPRPPYSPFPVYEGPYAVFRLFPAGVESSHRLFAAVGNFQITYCILVFGGHGKRLAADRGFSESPGIGHISSDFLQLVVVDCDSGSFYGFCCQDVRHRSPDFSGTGGFGYDSEIRRHQVAVREPAFLHVICRVKRIVPFLPVILVPVVAGFVIIRIRFVPFPHFFVRRDSGLKRHKSRHAAASPAAVE